MAKKQTITKKSEIEKEEKDFMPGAETEDQFDTVLSLLSQWMNADIVSVSIDLDGDVAFRLPKEMEKLLETQVPQGLTHKQVVSIIRNEIPALISSGLAKNKEQVLRSAIPGKLYEKIDVMVKRSEKAVNQIVDRSLEERIILRKTTPAYVVDDVQSIEGTYHVESENGKILNVPFISLQLTLAKPQSGYSLAVDPRERTIAFSRKDDIRVTLDMHKVDVKDLIEKLNKIEESCGRGE